MVHVHLIDDDIQRPQKHIIMFAFQHMTIKKTIHKRLVGKKEKKKKVVAHSAGVVGSLVTSHALPMNSTSNKRTDSGGIIQEPASYRVTNMKQKPTILEKRRSYMVQTEGASKKKRKANL